MGSIEIKKYLLGTSALVCATLLNMSPAAYAQEANTAPSADDEVVQVPTADEDEDEERGSTVQ